MLIEGARSAVGGLPIHVVRASCGGSSLRSHKTISECGGAALYARMRNRVATRRRRGNPCAVGSMMAETESVTDQPLPDWWSAVSRGATFPTKSACLVARPLVAAHSIEPFLRPRLQWEVAIGVSPGG
jgi:hypothetical protein